MAQVEAKLQAIEGLRAPLRLNQLTMHEHAKGVLTPEQWQKLEQLHDRPSHVSRDEWEPLALGLKTIADVSRKRATIAGNG